MADEIRALALTGMLGSGFHESSLERALSWEPNFIGCDAGSNRQRAGEPRQRSAGAAAAGDQARPWLIL